MRNLKINTARLKYYAADYGPLCFNGSQGRIQAGGGGAEVVPPSSPLK